MSNNTLPFVSTTNPPSTGTISTVGVSYVQTQSLGKLAEALSKAQAEIKGAIKDSENPHFRSSYADLESVWEACRGVITKYGLSVVQTNGRDQHGMYLRTTLLHTSGENISGDTPILLGTRQDMQALGSAITYARRYGLAAIVGIAPKDDDDGEAAVGRGNNIKAEAKAEPKIVQAEKKSGFRKETLKEEQTDGKDTKKEFRI